MTVASYLLFFVAALEVIRSVVGLATYGPMSDALGDAYASSEMADTIKTVTLGGVVAGAVVGLLLAAGFVVLGLLNNRGKNASRIVTWVIGGLSLCCLGVGLGGNALTSSIESGSAGTPGNPSPTEIQERMDAAMPSWAEPITITSTVLILLAMLVTIILLALPASNEFFRKPAAAGFNTVAPYPGQAYPLSPYPNPYGAQGQPGEPAPGLPPYPGQSSAGPYPGQPAPGPYPGQPAPGPHPGQPPSGPYPGPPAGLPPYPGQQPSGSPADGGQLPPPSDPFAPPRSPDDEPPRPPANPA